MKHSTPPSFFLSFFLSPYNTAKSYLTPNLAWYNCMTVPPFPFSFTSFYLTALHNPCAGSMTGCWAPVIRAGWYRQRTQRPLMLMFPPPGQIFLAHLEWERTGINMATWRGAWEAVAQSESATNPGPQRGNQLLFLLLLLFLPSPSSSICLLYPLNSWTDKRRARLVGLTSSWCLYFSQIQSRGR